MVVKKAEFIRSCFNPEQYPKAGWPEIAFAGRSNVGKSSLINSLTGKRNLAKVGKTPGVTTTINFININDELYFVDLPGYGYAARSREERQAWGPVIEAYLNNRKQLKAVVMLVDIRHKPTEDDVLMYNWINYHSLPHIILATKADKVSRSKYGGRIKEIRETLQVPENITILPVSSHSNIGIRETRKIIDSLIKE